MIKNVHFIENSKYLIAYIENDCEKYILYEDVNRIWADITPENFEYGKIKIYDKLIIFTMMTASGQGGTLFVWDTENKDFVHYADCSYCTDFVYHDDTIYTLHNIMNYVTPSHFRIRRTTFGTKDICDNGTILYAEEPHKVLTDNDFRSFDIDDLKMEVSNNSIFVDLKTNRYLFSSNIRNADKIKPSNKNMVYYKEWENEMDPNKIIIKGMLL